jgi:hypothetical protein
MVFNIFIAVFVFYHFSLVLLQLLLFSFACWALSIFFIAVFVFNNFSLVLL